MPDAEPTPLARALGRIPCGLYVVTTTAPEGPLGFVASLVGQAALAPPILSVSIARDRRHLPAVRAAGHFAVSILDDASRDLMGRFFRAEPPPFEGLPTRATADGDPILSAALAWMACRVVGEHECGDHVVVLGEAVEGELLREGDPSVHLRKNGLGY